MQTREEKHRVLYDYKGEVAIDLDQLSPSEKLRLDAAVNLLIEHFLAEQSAEATDNIV